MIRRDYERILSRQRSELKRRELEEGPSHRRLLARHRPGSTKFSTR
jgi:hypothetical protein